MSDDKKSPALLALVDRKWLTQAFDEMISGKQEIYFRTDSSQMGQSLGLPIKNVYFKLTGKTQVVAKADFIEVTKENPREKRLTGGQDDQGKFYHGFRGIALLTQPIPLSSLRFFSTGTGVPNDLPGACIIEEIG
jgi:hypothetical protein